MCAATHYNRVMTKLRDELLTEVHRFLWETGMPDTTFGRRATGDAHVVKRLEIGRDFRATTAEKLRAFMASERAKPEWPNVHAGRKNSAAA
jgi:hypothetical protein